jgi:hypothetical protein
MHNWNQIPILLFKNVLSLMVKERTKEIQPATQVLLRRTFLAQQFLAAAGKNSSALFFSMNLLRHLPPYIR